MTTNTYRQKIKHVKIKEELKQIAKINKILKTEHTNDKFNYTGRSIITDKTTLHNKPDITLIHTKK